jgi:hypothetical protein
MITMKKRYKLIPILFVMMFGFALVSPALAAAELSPEGATLIAGIPFQFNLTGMNASKDFGASIDAGSTWEYNGTADADGDAIFSITITESGDYTLGIYDGYATVQDTVSIAVIDLVEMIMPYVILIVTLSVLFGVVGMIQGMIKFKKR